MAFFLKKTTLKNRTYLAIYESFYSHQKKGTAHKCFRSLGSIETLMENGMDNPIAHFQKEVDALNTQRQQEGTRQISAQSPLLSLGYFPLKRILEKLDIKKYVDYFTLTNEFHYDLYELLTSLIYARSVNPCSKNRTFHEVLPNLYQSVSYSYDQLLDGLSFLGSNYEKFVEVFTARVAACYGLDPSTSYFDCTNFFFEIDREDDFRRKGPSKENRKTPIVGLGLLLDAHQIPIGMKMYPGNQSEKPILRSVIELLKAQHHVIGKTIHVADKGLNCAANIALAKKNGDGYLFSRAVKTLSAIEKVWVLLDQDFTEVKDDAGTLLYRYKSCVDTFPYTIEHEGKKKVLSFTEKRLLTYNPSLAAKKRYEINRLVEKAKALTFSKAKLSDCGEAGKYILFTDDKAKQAQVTINQAAIDKDLQFAGYNLLITSEVDMDDLSMYHTYHNLWRIEESFKIMKSDLDARPVFLRKEDSIKGHFLICYLTVLLERLFEFKVLKNEFAASEIFRFFKAFKVTKADSSFINTTTSSALVSHLAKQFQLPLTNYFLTEAQIKSILGGKLS